MEVYSMTLSIVSLTCDNATNHGTYLSVTFGMSPAINIGILAIQGAFAEHEYNLKRCFENDVSNNHGLQDLRLDVIQVRCPGQLAGLDGLIIPGGESTTMAKFLEKHDFKHAIESWRNGNGHGAPIIWGTCAGLILLANNLEDTKTGGQFSIGGLDITASRNTFGRQIDSFETDVDIISERLQVTDRSEINVKYHGVFIRAPGIKSVDDPNVEVLATIHRHGETRVVAVQQGSLMATSFHPELTDDLRWHAYFIHNVCTHKRNLSTI